MIIPERTIFQRLVGALKDERCDDQNVLAYAKSLLAIVDEYGEEPVAVAIQYLLTANVDALLEFHGNPEPERGQIVILRYHLNELKNRAEASNIPLPSSQLQAIARVTSERDRFSTEAIKRPSLDSGVAKRLSQDASRSTTGVRRSTVSSRSEFPIAPAARASLDAPPPEEIQEFDILGRPKRRNELKYYFFSAVMLGIAVALSLEVLEVRWAPWLKAVVSAAIPIGLLGVLSFSKSLVVLRYLRRLLIWGSVGAVVLAGSTYAYSTYVRIVTMSRYQQVNRDFDILQRALAKYHQDEKIYPRGLEVLNSPVNYLKGTQLDGESYFEDPFSRNGAAYTYQRTLDAYMIQSAGPSRKIIELGLPSKMTPDFRDTLTNVSYDPTNGLLSPGKVFLMGVMRGQDAR